MHSNLDVQEFLGLVYDDHNLPLALIVPDGVLMAIAPISNEDGTFLARSDNPCARVVAVLTGLSVMETCYADSR